jgi:L-lactate utilization protein LutB
MTTSYEDTAGKLISDSVVHATLIDYKASNTVRPFFNDMLLCIMCGSV